MLSDCIRRVVREAGSRVRRASGQSTVEAAVAFPLLLFVAIGLVQFAVFCHAQTVVMGAVQDGARVASAEDRSLTDGVAHAEAVLRAGIGPAASDVTVRGDEGDEVIVVEAQGSLKLFIPWLAGGSVPLRARSVVSKEKFRVGPGG